MPAALTGAPAEVCVGPIKYIGHDFDHPRPRQPEGGQAGPRGLLHQRRAGDHGVQGVNEYYKTEEEYVYAIAEALREEYRAIIDAGFILQVDDAVLANMYDYLIEQGEDVYRRWARLRVEALNHTLEGIPEDRIRYHICFGSWHVPHVADAPLEAIVPSCSR